MFPVQMLCTAYVGVPLSTGPRKKNMLYLAQENTWHHYFSILNNGYQLSACLSKHEQARISTALHLFGIKSA